MGPRTDRPVSMTDYFTDPLGGLPEQEWNALAGDRFYSSALWLRLCTLFSGAVSGGVHVTLSDGGRAAVPVAAVTDEPNRNLRWHDQLVQRGLPAPPADGILVGQRRGYQAHLLAGHGADPVEVAGTLLEAVREIRTPDGAEPSACVAMYLSTADVLALRDAGVRTLPVALKTDAAIDIPPGGWDAWQAALREDHRWTAQRIRKEVRKFDEAHYRVVHSTLRQSYQDVARLMARTEGRYGRVVDVPALTESFRQQGELAGDHAEVLLCSIDDEPPIGCCLFYRWHDTIFLRAVGFEYEKLRKATEYFNLTYYLPARLPGVRRLHAGTGSPEAKAMRGAKLEPLWLLDLAWSSTLSACDDEVRQHNRRFRAGLADSSKPIAEALDDDSWAPFC
jgi:uncharacterized protein